MEEQGHKDITPEASDDRAAVLGLLNSDAWQKRLDEARLAREKVLAARGAKPGTAPPSVFGTVTRLDRPGVPVVEPVAAPRISFAASAPSEAEIQAEMEAGADWFEPPAPRATPVHVRRITPTSRSLTAPVRALPALTEVPVAAAKRNPLRIAAGFAIGVLAGAAIASFSWVRDGSAVAPAPVAAAAPRDTAPVAPAVPAAVPMAVEDLAARVLPGLEAEATAAVDPAPPIAVSRLATGADLDGLLPGAPDVLKIGMPLTGSAALPPPALIGGAEPGAAPGGASPLSAPLPELGAPIADLSPVAGADVLAALAPAVLPSVPGAETADAPPAPEADPPPLAAAAPPAPPARLAAEPAGIVPDAPEGDAAEVAVAATPLVITMGDGAIEAMLTPHRIKVLGPPSVADSALAATAETLRVAGFTVADPSHVGVTIRASHVRFYHEADRATAMALASSIGGEARDFTATKQPPGAGLIELWLEGSAPTAVAEKPVKAKAKVKAKATAKATAPRAPQAPAEDPQVRSLRDKIVRQLQQGDHL